MAETASELKERVDQARKRLEQDLNSLQYHIRASLDWRTQYHRSPWVFLGAAFGSALMLGLAFSRMLAGLGRSRRVNERGHQFSAQP
jgi:ElaB/YqjD/DUF883 family membrane-anchored ribosome-binding protein